MKFFKDLKYKWSRSIWERQKNARMEKSLKWLECNKETAEYNYVYGSKVKPYATSKLLETFWHCFQVTVEGNDFSYYAIDGVVAKCHKTYGVWQELCDEGERTFDKLKKRYIAETDEKEVDRLSERILVLGRNLNELMSPKIIYTIHTWFPGRTIGKGGETVDRLTALLKESLGMDVAIEFEELKEDGPVINIKKTIPSF